MRDFMITNVPSNTSEDNIRSFFKDLGEIDNVRIVYDRETNMPSFSMIRFMRDDVNVPDCVTIDGVQVKVNPCKRWAPSQYPPPMTGRFLSHFEDDSEDDFF